MRSLSSFPTGLPRPDTAATTAGVPQDAHFGLTSSATSRCSIEAPAVAAGVTPCSSPNPGRTRRRADPLPCLFYEVAWLA
jgi:hypothetical protein